MTNESIRLLLETGDRDGVMLAEGRQRRRLPWSALTRIVARRASFGDGALTCLVIDLTDGETKRHNMMVSELETGFDDFLRALAAALPAIPHGDALSTALRKSPHGLLLHPPK